MNEEEMGEEKYLVTFVAGNRDLPELERLLRNLARKDDTFSYSERMNYPYIEDNDKKRIFRRAMWICNALQQNHGIEISFTMQKLPPEKV